MALNFSVHYMAQSGSGAVTHPYARRQFATRPVCYTCVQWRLTACALRTAFADNAYGAAGGVKRRIKLVHFAARGSSNFVEVVAKCNK